MHFDQGFFVIVAFPTNEYDRLHADFRKGPLVAISGSDMKRIGMVEGVATVAGQTAIRIKLFRRYTVEELRDIWPNLDLIPTKRKYGSTTSNVIG